jgi:hypothetical protein
VKKYRKKPVVIEAVHFDGSNAQEVLEFARGVCYIEADPMIRTLEGDMRVSDGDYVIRGVQGEFYPCKSDIFEATYERVAEDGSGVPVSEVRGDEAP